MKIEYLVSRKYPSYPDKANKILSRHLRYSQAYEEAVRLSKRLKGGSVEILKSKDSRIILYEVYKDGKLVLYGMEVNRKWQHFDIGFESPMAG